MDLLEAGRRFRLPPELLRLYEENGLLQGRRRRMAPGVMGERRCSGQFRFGFCSKPGWNWAR